MFNNDSHDDDRQYRLEAIQAWRSLRALLDESDLFVALEGGIISGDLKIAFLIEGLPRHDKKNFARLLWEPKAEENDANGYLDFQTQVSVDELRGLVASFEFTEDEQNRHSFYGSRMREKTEMRLVISIPDRSSGSPLPPYHAAC